MWTVYTDGSCLGNPGPGGRSALASSWKKEITLSGGAKLTTNNIMELTAVVEALKYLWQTLTKQQRMFVETDAGEGLFSTTKNYPSVTDPVTIITDSTYVQKGITEWIIIWKKRQRRRAKWGKLVEHVLLRKELDALVGCFTHMTRAWTKAHVGTELNERADLVARSEAEKRM